MKLYQFLDQLFNFRILRNDDIPLYLKRMSQLGKFDQPKQVMLITELTRRVAALEERQELTVFGEKPSTLPVAETSPLITDLEKEPSWNELQQKAKELGVFKIGMKKEEVKSAIKSAQ